MNMTDLESFEQRIKDSKYGMLRCFDTNRTFSIDSNLALMPGRWGLDTPHGEFLGKSLKEVMDKAVVAGFPVYEIIDSFEEPWNEQENIMNLYDARRAQHKNFVSGG
jgi:hypothetical protein